MVGGKRGRGNNIDIETMRARRANGRGRSREKKTSTYDLLEVGAEHRIVDLNRRGRGRSGGVGHRILNDEDIDEELLVGG